MFILNQELERAKNIIHQTISSLNLDLSGLTILTEVGSNNFIYTPLIALMANAKQVYAWAKDSPYGKANEIVRDCKEIGEYYELDLSKLTFAINDRPGNHVSNSDIITNSGAVRPLNKMTLEVAKTTAVIPLMYEAWEWRDGEIDKEYCIKKGLKIGGTWENHPELKIFDYCGSLGIKMMYEAGMEIFRNKILIWSNDHFGEIIAQAFISLKAEEVILTVDNKRLLQNIKTLDAIFICDYDEKKSIIGKNGFMDLELIKSINPAITIVHLYGDIDNKYCEEKGIKLYPQKPGKAEVMTFTLAHVGLNPVIKLQIAGLKVGELLLNKTEHPLCQKIT